MINSISILNKTQFVLDHLCRHLLLHLCEKNSVIEKPHLLCYAHFLNNNKKNSKSLLLLTWLHPHQGFCWNRARTLAQIINILSDISGTSPYGKGKTACLFSPCTSKDPFCSQNLNVELKIYFSVIIKEWQFKVLVIKNPFFRNYGIFSRKQRI